MKKLILDATCGNRGIWFQKNEPHTVYCDKRTAHYEMDFGDKYPGHRVIDVNPDVECDFTDLPFEDGMFNLVVIDPPHLLKKDESWLKKQYGYYDTKADALESIGKGIRECMRVLRRGGYSSSNGANSTYRHARSSTLADTNRCSGIEAARRRTRIGSAS